ncbi:MAG TPA: exosortase/archaeosortase family protein [Pirellulales bacterium]|jgi:exosortase
MSSSALPPDSRRGTPAVANTSVPRNHAAASGQQQGELTALAAERFSWTLVFSLGCLAATFLWIYWPTFLRLMVAWNVEPDYSHGYFVVPLALFFLWIRRDGMPQLQGPSWGGLILIAAGLAMHVFGSFYYLEPLNGWSMSVWLAGAAWLLGGRKFCQWCLPSALFLLFMVPLPFGVEMMFRQPLQRIATEVSCWTLQSLGMPALAAGNVISIDGTELEVARACSGLRIFVSIVALAFAYAVIVRRPWWTKALIFASALPIAIVANAVRVTLVAIGYSYTTSATSHNLVHDLAGWFVIPLAAALMGSFIWYLGKLIVQVQPMTRQELLRG